MAETMTAEKVATWLNRSRYSRKDMAKELGISEKVLDYKIRTNHWEQWEIKLLKRLGI